MRKLNSIRLMENNTGFMLLFFQYFFRQQTYLNYATLYNIFNLFCALFICLFINLNFIYAFFVPFKNGYNKGNFAKFTSMSSNSVKVELKQLEILKKFGAK